MRVLVLPCLAALAAVFYPTPSWASSEELSLDDSDKPDSDAGPALPFTEDLNALNYGPDYDAPFSPEDYWGGNDYDEEHGDYFSELRLNATSDAEPSDTPPPPPPVPSVTEDEDYEYDHDDGESEEEEEEAHQSPVQSTTTSTMPPARIDDEYDYDDYNDSDSDANSAAPLSALLLSTPRPLLKTITTASYWKSFWDQTSTRASTESSTYPYLFSSDDSYSSSLAWDAAGVTTAAITVPLFFLVLACLGCACRIGFWSWWCHRYREPAPDRVVIVHSMQTEQTQPPPQYYHPSQHPGVPCSTHRRVGN